MNEQFQSPRLFAEPFLAVRHGRELADYDGVLALFRKGAVIVSVPPDRADALQSLFAGHPKSPDGFASALRALVSAVVGPAFIGYAESLVSPTHAARPLGPDDTAALHAMEKACDATEWEHGGSSGERPISGVFVGDRLVSVAGYEVWGGAIAHISIITAAEFRGQGFGRSAVAHVGRRTIAAGLLPQYRTLEANGASIRIAEALGFCRCATSMAARLNGVA